MVCLAAALSWVSWLHGFETAGKDAALIHSVELGSVGFASNAPLRATFVGGDLDVANAFALWSMQWAKHLGVREDRHRRPAPLPVVELFVLCPEEAVELAYAVAYLCECIWADAGFAGMAHVATDRIDALRDSSVIVDTTTAPAQSMSGFDLEAYRSSTRMDAMLLAPRAELYFIDEGTDPWTVLPRYS